MKLSRIDLKILNEVQKNARITNLELSEKVGLSPSPCLRRVKQLEEAGFIDAYVTRLNQQKVDLKLMALIQISMDKHTPERFEQALLSTKRRLEEDQGPPIVTINCWNEWTEGSYLEPDTINGMEYLQAIKEVFGE